MVVGETIRLADAADCARVKEIVRAAYAVYVPRIGREPAPMLDDYGALIRARCVHVLEQGGEVQGIIVLIREEGAMLLDNVAVDPEMQGRGIGRRLLDFAEETARAEWFRMIRLYTNEVMTENIALYVRIGYVETHRGEEKGMRRVYMQKALG